MRLPKLPARQKLRHAGPNRNDWLRQSGRLNFAARKKPGSRQKLNSASVTGWLRPTGRQWPQKKRD